MKTFVDWLSDHTITAMLAAGCIGSIVHLFVRRRELFHKK
jgi:hypothetical protein